MEALKAVAVLYGILFLVYGYRNRKRFLLLTGIISLPFWTDYAITDVGFRQGWTSGIIIKISDLSFLLLLIYVLVKRVPADRYLSGIAMPAVFFISACALSVFNSTAGMLTLYQVVMMCQLVLLYYVAFTLAIETREDLRAVIAFIAISILFQSSIAVYQFYSGNAVDYFSTGKGLRGFIEASEDFGVRRVFGTVGHPNSLAAYLIPLLLVIMCWILGEGKKIRLEAVALAIGVLAVVMTYSRGGWIGFTLGITVIIFSALRSRRTGTGAVIAVLMVLAVIGVYFYHDISTRLSGFDDRAALSRIPLMKVALKMASDHPILGVGANTFRNVIRDYSSGIEFSGIYLNQVHNQFLLVLAETGAVGLLAFMWVIKSLVSQSRLCMKKNERRVYFLGLGTLSAYVAMSFHMMVDVFDSYLLLSNMFMIAGVCTAAARLYAGTPVGVAERADDIMPARSAGKFRVPQGSGIL